MLSEDEDSESEISDFDVFDEANDMEERYVTMHGDECGSVDDARTEVEMDTEESENESNQQGKNNSNDKKCSIYKAGSSFCSS